MTGYETFGIFQALKLHFTKEAYDFFKYNGKTNLTVNSFENRKDKYHFYKLSRKFNTKEELIDFIVFNLIEDENLWVGNLLQDEADARYLKHKKYHQAISYMFKEDCQKLFNGLNNPNSLLFTDGDYPILLTRALRKEIEIETLCILNMLLNFFPMWSKKISDTIRWPEYRKTALKYTAFMPQDSVRYKLILKEVLNQNTK